MGEDPTIQVQQNKNRFQISCLAGDAGEFRVGTEYLSVRVGQRVRRANSEEMWESVGIDTYEENGSLVVRVLIFNPDWDEPLQIANVRSRPLDLDCLTPLGCNLNHVAVQSNQPVEVHYEVLGT